MNILIASAAIIARSYAILDWGWKLRSLSPLIFENTEGEEVKYVTITGVYALRNVTNKGKLYYVMDGLDRYPNDLQFLADEMKLWNVIRYPANEGKIKNG